MSAICILVPAVIAGWPVISAAAAGAAAALGLAVASEVGERTTTRTSSRVTAKVAGAMSVEIELDNSEVLAESVATDQQIVLMKGDIRIRVYRDERGMVRVSAEGLAHTRQELQDLCQQVVDKMTQIFVYNKVMTELKQKGFTVVEDQVSDDESVRISVRRTVN
jgi:hypothetical protein